MFEKNHSLNFKSSNYQPLAKTFSLQLESLRGLSAIVVLFSHAFQAFVAPQDVTLYSIVRLLGHDVFCPQWFFDWTFDTEKYSAKPIIFN